MANAKEMEPISHSSKIKLSYANIHTFLKYNTSGMVMVNTKETDLMSHSSEISLCST